MLLMSIGALSIPMADSMVKLLSETISVGMITWLRFLIQGVVIYLFLHFSKRALERPTLPHIWLALMVSLAILFLFWGLKYLPLANNITLFFVEPLILVVLSAIFLQERITKAKLIAVFFGLLGAIIVIRPNWSLYGVAALLPIASALCFAIYMVLTRYFSRIGKLGSALALQLWVSVIAGGLFTLIIMGAYPLKIEFFALKVPDVGEVSLLFLAGVIGAFVHILVTMALKKADASILAPLQYLEIIGGALLGWMIFGDVLDMYTIIGGVMIVGAGVYVFAQERKLARLQAQNLI
jgi:S-adenosylmethionine uptake transporter